MFLSWNPWDQDKALTYVREMRKVCQRCGTRPEEWEHNPNAYLGHIFDCEGCRRVAAEDDNMPDEPKQRRGMTTGLLPEAMAKAEALRLAEKDKPHG